MGHQEPARQRREPERKVSDQGVANRFWRVRTPLQGAGIVDGSSGAVICTQSFASALRCYFRALFLDGVHARAADGSRTRRRDSPMKTWRRWRNASGMGRSESSVRNLLTRTLVALAEAMEERREDAGA